MDSFESVASSRPASFSPLAELNPVRWLSLGTSRDTFPGIT